LTRTPATTASLLIGGDWTHGAGRPGVVRSGEVDRQRLGEARQLVREIGMCVEVEVPPVARKSPVPDVRDPPGRQWFEVDDEVDAAAIGAVHVTTAEDHLTTILRGSALAGCEPKWGQDRIEDLDDLINRTRAGWLANR
jgi:hypothetical protein